MQSSAVRMNLESKLELTMSLKYKRNNIGPSMDPRGTQNEMFTVGKDTLLY